MFGQWSVQNLGDSPIHLVYILPAQHIDLLLNEAFVAAIDEIGVPNVVG